MKASVRAAFVPMTKSFEGGYITWMFPDVKDLVSTGFGILLDPVSLALGLPWKRSDGSLASRAEIIADWNAVKTYPNAARLGHLSVEHIAKLRLDDEGLYAAFQSKLASNEAYLRGQFDEWGDWPADAQLGVLSMAWAVGAAFQHTWPKFTAALRARDFDTAAVECFMPEEDHIGGLRPRNKANRILFRNAARVGGDMDPETLYYPADLSATSS